MLNGKPFVVRQNLHDFLLAVSTEHQMSHFTQEDYWIDALCINQFDNSERSHQVAQMGQIYSNAWRVHIWLGRTPDAGQIAEVFAKDFAPTYSNPDAIIDLRRKTQLVTGYVLHNDYWNRAWVIQEIILANSAIISLDTTTLPLRNFCERMHQIPVYIWQTPFEQFDTLGSHGGHAVLRGKSLLLLLYWFRNKQCSIPHDRVFALLGICHKSDKLEIDYEMRLSDLAFRILRHPDELCICVAALVARSLTPAPNQNAAKPQTSTRRLMLSFAGDHIGTYSSESIRYLRPRSDTAPLSSRIQYGCFRYLVQEFGELFRTSSLGDYIRQRHMGPVSFVHAVREVLIPEPSGLRLKSDPNDMSYRWYVDSEGWNVGICDKDPQFCRVRIALDRLLDIFRWDNVCIFPKRNFLNLEKAGNPRRSPKSPKSPLEPISPKPAGMEDIERCDKSSLFMMEWEHFVDEG
ncbi:hypothetical protein GT037_007336 [Alternaria burnsii]|uniref:Heterokaryon incompatibility domain-containing protein n=1 Tax=Alternaria burnsii TaxID=1187904 RepID=A0A8H7EDW8_9PLEO|nr:uncharacterized protein GT037_007336 [Alternaria burnsii]KAF7674576.1 hypothetical protein GT037_007336 [Alternaria burnsii]